MFRDRHQLAHCCRVLLSLAGLQHLWTTRAGPTREALELLEHGGGKRLESPQERALLLAAWAFWTADPRRIDDLMPSLDPPRAHALRSLAMASGAGADAIDAWLTTYEPPTTR